MKCSKCSRPLGSFSTVMGISGAGQMIPMKLFYCQTCRRQITVPHCQG